MPYFMEPESLLTYSQQPTFTPHPAPDESSSTPQITFHSMSASLDKEGHNLLKYKTSLYLQLSNRLVGGTRVAKQAGRCLTIHFQSCIRNTKSHAPTESPSLETALQHSDHTHMCPNFNFISSSETRLKTR